MMQEGMIKVEKNKRKAEEMTEGEGGVEVHGKKEGKNGKNSKRKTR